MNSEYRRLSVHGFALSETRISDEATGFMLVEAHRKETMKVVLLENISGLGTTGDKKEVADGYARNYLLPKKLVVKLGDAKAKILLKNISKKRGKITGEIKKLEKVAKEYENKEIKFALKASSKGKLFGSVGPEDVSQKLKIDKKQIDFPPIRMLGEHKVKINLGHGIKSCVKIVIESKEEKK